MRTEKKMIAEPLSLIDTDILSYVLKRKEPAYQNYECIRGYKAVGATKRLEVFQELLQITDVIYFDKPILDKAGEIYGVLKTKGLLKGEFDLLIGATAIVNQMKIVTNNEKHYQPLKDYFNLEVENWMNQ